MALEKEVLRDSLIAALSVPDPKINKDGKSLKEVATALADAIYNFVVEGEVKDIVSEFTGEVKIKIPDSATELTGTFTGTATQSKPVNIT